MTSEPNRSVPMTCAEVEAQLEAYLAGELAPAVESRLATHLMACRRCAAEVALGERVAFELSALPAFDAPPELITRLKRAARETPRGREARRLPAVAALRRRRRLVPLALAAALMAALGLGWWQRARPVAPPVGPAQTSPPTVAEIAAAEQEARYALALVARLGRRAGEEIRQEVLIERIAVPLVRGVGGPLQRAAMKSGGMES